MGKHVFNRGKAPAIYGMKVNIPPESYDGFGDEMIDQLKTTSLPLIYEGDEGFCPLWIRNCPEKTPNQILD
jgi:hypothetical protein